MRYLLLSALCAACFGCSRQAAPTIITRVVPTSSQPAAPKLSKVTVNELPKNEVEPTALDTPFFSIEQRQAIEVMKVNDVAEFGYTAELTVVEESEVDRERREMAAARRAAYEAAIAPVDYSKAVEDAMEVLLRAHFAKQLESAQRETIYLAVHGRKPGRKLLQRFANDSVDVRDADQRANDHVRSSVCEIKSWKEAGTDRASFSFVHHGGCTYTYEFLMVHDGIRWRVESIKDICIFCGDGSYYPIPSPPILID